MCSTRDQQEKCERIWPVLILPLRFLENLLALIRHLARNFVAAHLLLLMSVALPVSDRREAVTASKNERIFRRL